MTEETYRVHGILVKESSHPRLTSNEPTVQSDTEIAANCLLLLTANLLGLTSYYLADKQQRRAFLETRQSLEMKLVIEEQSAEQFSHFKKRFAIYNFGNTALNSPCTDHSFQPNFGTSEWTGQYFTVRLNSGFCHFTANPSEKERKNQRRDA
uniref:Uncharacterized protein n=1 Tax=Timema cristinae TaxID=61476 RepID=A0A7R9CRT0_TIMCR|nr:unnamed protein product [Timema cristinae]